MALGDAPRWLVAQGPERRPDLPAGPTACRHIHLPHTTAVGPSCSPVPAWFLSVCWSWCTVTTEQVTNGWCQLLSSQRGPEGNGRGSQNGFITNLWPQR